MWQVMPSPTVPSLTQVPDTPPWLSSTATHFSPAAQACLDGSQLLPLAPLPEVPLPEVPLPVVPVVSPWHQLTAWLPASVQSLQELHLKTLPSVALKPQALPSGAAQAWNDP